jgi:CHASE2 domain-containing sensor protein
VPSKFWIQFLSACIAAFLLEQAADFLVEATSHETSAVSQSIFDISGVYQQLVTTGPRRPIPHYTTIIEIDPDPELDPLAVGFNSLCRQRAFLAVLLRVVADAHPAIIVVDKYFDSSKCLVDDNEKKDTGQLESALATLAPEVPIVSGVDATPTKGRRPDLNSPLAPQRGDSLFRLAVVNLDLDTRRLPMRWVHVADPEILKRTDNGRSLALQTAAQYDSRILAKNRRLAGMVDRGENPYISFLGADQFDHLYAGETLCLEPEKIPADWSVKCPEVAKNVAERTGKRELPVLGNLNHRIVVIGERAEREDIHNSAIGEVPGFYLQANYIEALLDDRLFRPVPPPVNYLFGFLIFAAFEYILIKNLPNPFTAIFWIIFLLFATIVVLYLAVVHSGFYLNPVTVGLLAIFINLGHLAIARSEEHEEAEKELHHQEGI